jgi:hypothetical protein
METVTSGHTDRAPMDHAPLAAIVELCCVPAGSLARQQLITTRLRNDTSYQQQQQSSSQRRHEAATDGLERRSTCVYRAIGLISHRGLKLEHSYLQASMRSLANWQPSNETDFVTSVYN